MGKNCEFVYLDETGKRSAHYYDLVKEHGHEVAEANYINAMLAIASAKQSKHKGLEMLKERHTQMTNLHGTQPDYIGVTKVIGNFKNEMSDEAKTRMAVNLRVDDEAEKYRKSNNSSKFNYS